MATENDDNGMEDEMNQLEETIPLSARINRRSSRIRSKSQKGDKTTSKNNKNEEGKTKSKSNSKLNSSTTIKINSSHINKAKEENSVNTRSSRRNSVAGSKDAKNNHKKSDSAKTGKETEEKKISIIIKKSLIDAATNNTINNHGPHKKSKNSDQVESIDNGEQSPSKNVLPIKISKNIKSKLKITMGKDKKDNKKDDIVESKELSGNNEKQLSIVSNSEMKGGEIDQMNSDATIKLMETELSGSSNISERIEVQRLLPGRGRRGRGRGRRSNKTRKEILSNQPATVIVIDGINLKNGFKNEKESLKDLEKLDDKSIETSSSSDLVNNVNVLPKTSNKKENSSLQTPPETPLSSETVAPLSNLITKSDGKENKLDGTNKEKEDKVLHELGMDDNDDSNSELSSLSEFDYDTSDNDDNDAASVHSDVSVSSLFSDNSSLSSISTMSFSSSISTRSKMRGINLQEAKVDLILPNDDITNDNINANNADLTFNNTPKKTSVVTFTDEKVDQKQRVTRKRKNIDDQQLKPAIKMNYKKVKTNKEERKSKNVSINEVVQIHTDAGIKQKEDLEKEKISDLSKPVGNSTTIIAQPIIVAENVLPSPIDSSSSTISKECVTSINASIDLSEIQHSKKRKMSVSDSSDSSDSKTDDQKDSLYHTYLAIGEIVKTDPLFMDLTLEERIKLRRRQRNSKETILSFEDFNLEDLEKYKTMRKNNDSTLNHKRKTRGRRGNNNNESYPLHSIEAIVAKNKSSDSATISDRYNLQTLLKNGTDIEAHSVYKKSKSSKSKKLDAGHINSKNEDQSVNSTVEGKIEEKVDVKSEIKGEVDTSQKVIKQETDNLTNDSLKDNNIPFDATSSSINEDDKSTVIPKKESITENQSEIKTEMKKDSNVTEGIKQIKTEKQSNVKIEQKIENESSSNKVNIISSLVNVKPNDIQISGSTPNSPVVKKRKRGRPSRASKSNTTSPLSFSPSSSTTNSIVSSPVPSNIDYTLYNMSRSSRRTHHGTFEKRCVQCNKLISPSEYAKNGVICGHCWKLNFKD